MDKPKHPLDNMTAHELLERIIPNADQLVPGMQDLPSAVECPATSYAQRVRDAAYSSIVNMWWTMRLSRDLQKEVSGQKRQGRLADEEVDLLRGIIVFAGAGLDATLKALITSSLPELAEVNEQVEGEFTKFVERQIDDPKHLATVLVHPDRDIRGELLRRYVARLTGDSLQSVGQAEKVIRALGLSEDSGLRKAARPGTALHDLFVARNKIVHELDTTPKAKHDRQYRNFKDTVRMVHAALVFAQHRINGVAEQINETN